MLIKSSFKLIFDILFYTVVINAIATFIMMPIEGFDISFSIQFMSLKENFHRRYILRPSTKLFFLWPLFL